jgi:hypothetical protein
VDLFIRNCIMTELVIRQGSNGIIERSTPSILFLLSPLTFWLRSIVRLIKKIKFYLYILNKTNDQI